MTPVVHIAGQAVLVGTIVRQRCAWCGAILIDCDTARIAVSEGQDPSPPTWTRAELVAVDGNASYVVAHEDGADLPDGACGALDPEVTR